MNQKILLVAVSALLLVGFALTATPAVAKPDVTSHEATFLGNAVIMHIEWQSPNPVVLVRISIANKQQEVKVDPYDNVRNPSGYAGEVNVTIGLDFIPSPPFPYVILLEDELRLKSAQVTGKVKVASSPQPQYPQSPQTPSMQIQIQQNIPQPSLPLPSPPGSPSIPSPGDSQPTFPVPQQPGATQPFPPPGLPPGVTSGGQPGATITVIIIPQLAADEGGMWRVGNHPWRKSGESIPDLPAGFHAIEFQEIRGWTKPDILNVTVGSGQNLRFNGMYYGK